MGVGLKASLQLPQHFCPDRPRQEQTVVRTIEIRVHCTWNPPQLWGAGLFDVLSPRGC